MTRRPDGQVVPITGAARGIGAAAAHALAAGGARHVLVGLEPELLNEVAARLPVRSRAQP